MSITINQLPKAAQYITRFATELDPNAQVSWAPHDFTCAVELRSARVLVRFSRELIEDFEAAIESYKGTRYFETIRNRVRFPILITVGEKGLIPEFKISSELLHEEGEWLRTFRADVEFPSEIYAALDHGLELLSGSMERQLSTGLKLPDIEADKRIVDSLREYYRTTKNFNSRDAELGSLSFLKAAAVCIVIELEQKRAAERRPRLREAFDREIYSLVSSIRDDPLVDVKLPDALRDYAAEAGTEAIASVYHRARTPDPTQARLRELLEKLDPKLMRRWEGAWDALDSSNPDRFSQAANSMVELLDQVIKQVCTGTDLANFLQTRYSTHQQTEWVTATRGWISKTKNDMHATKHHSATQSEHLTRRLLQSAELIILVLLESPPGAT
jgi:hypothetical protein